MVNCREVEMYTINVLTICPDDHIASIGCLALSYMCTVCLLYSMFTSRCLSSGVRDMFAQVAMRVVELSKRAESMQHSYPSFSSQISVNHEQLRQHQQKQEKEESAAVKTTPNIQLTDEKPKKEGWCCWR